MTELQVGTNGFVFVDHAESTYASGIVRAGKKILVDGAVALARCTTYGFASLGLPGSGASAGVSFGTGDRAGAVSEFIGAFSAGRETGEISNTIELVGGEEFASLPPGPLSSLGPDKTSLHVASTLAVATAWLGTYPKTALVTGAGPVTEALVLQLREHGVGVSTPAEVSGEVEMAFLGAGGGELTHTNLASLPAQTILGYQPNSVTARGLAEAKRGGVAVLPEFVAASGPLVAYEAARSTEEHLAVAASRVAAFVEQIDRSAAAGPYLEACFLAEAFIRSWSSDLPFGRPLA